MAADRPAAEQSPAMEASRGSFDERRPDRLTAAGRRAGFATIALAAASLALAAPTMARERSGDRVTAVTVTAGRPTEFGFTLSRKKVPVGRVKFTVRNPGTVPHDFEVCSSPKGGTADSCKGTKTKEIEPGASAVLTLTFPAKGRHEYLCTVPGHPGAGMKGVLTVG
jgi:uncharacterized cupredoxin-like copper-binding protein